MALTSLSDGAPVAGVGNDAVPVSGRIRLLIRVQRAGSRYGEPYPPPGAILETDADEAKRLIAGRFADIAPEPEPAPEPAEPEEEQATVPQAPVERATVPRKRRSK